MACWASCCRSRSSVIGRRACGEGAGKGPDLPTHLEVSESESSQFYVCRTVTVGVYARGIGRASKAGSAARVNAPATPPPRPPRILSALAQSLRLSSTHSTSASFSETLFRLPCLHQAMPYRMYLHSSQISQGSKTRFKLSTHLRSQAPVPTSDRAVAEESCTW